MKSVLVSAMFFAALLAAPWSYAQEQKRDQEQIQHRQSADQHHTNLIHELGINEETASKLRSAIETTRQQIAPLLEEIRTIRAEIEKHLRADIPDDAAAIAAVDKMSRLYKQIIAIRVENRKLITALLTPEQLAKFNELRAKMEANRQTRMQQRLNETRDSFAPAKKHEQGERPKPEKRGKGNGPQSRRHQQTMSAGRL